MEILEKEITNSSQVKRVKYDENKSILTITFMTGKSYEYEGVKRYEFDALLAAESVGKYLNASIKPNHKFKAI
jgi:hypothetical protein